MSASLPWLEEFARHVGEREIPGPDHNPWVLEMVRKAGLGERIRDDETAWCATSLNGVLVTVGLPPSSPGDPARRALAQSFRSYGTRLATPVPGAIVVFPRGAAWQGHVGVVETVNVDGTVTLISGNDGDAVRRSSRYRIRDAFPDGIRWPPGVPLPEGAFGAAPAPARRLGERTIRMGDRGEDVAEWQRALNGFGYALSADGVFGAATHDATLRRQQHARLRADGVVGPATLAATRTDLAERRRAGERARTADDVREEIGREVTDTVEKKGGWLAAGGTALAGVQGVLAAVGGNPWAMIALAIVLAGAAVAVALWLRAGARAAMQKPLRGRPQRDQHLYPTIEVMDVPHGMSRARDVLEADPAAGFDLLRPQILAG